jgi:3-oxoacyl-[acyl-carrier protein] reductase
MRNIVDLTGRTIVVTGAAQGIGRACCNLIVELGGNVVAVDLQADALQSLAEEAGADHVLPLAGSVADEEFAESAVGAAVERFGAVHGLVNGAGIVRAAMIEKMTLDQWRQVIDIHLTGSFIWIQKVGRHMIARHRDGDDTGGSIINISSVAGKRGSIGQINYAAAKGGMLAMTMSVVREWSQYLIRCNTVYFGPVITPMTETVRQPKFNDKLMAQVPMNRWAEPEEVVKTLAFLLSDASSFTTGQHYGVDGGQHLSS